MKNVVFVHYHLRGGGVTRVIEHAQLALESAGIKSAVLAGETPPENCPLKNVFVVDGLGYAKAGAEKHITPESAASALSAAAREALGEKPDLYHIHNHSLGKNAFLPAAVCGLAAKGAKILLQAHDFAEDGRPQNYGLLRSAFADASGRIPGSSLYPQAGNVHYALINGRDRNFLNAAGVAEKRLHSLPNAAHVPEPKENATPFSLDGCKRLFLYPTRGIRRKNIGEFLLLSCLGGDGDLFGSTLAPKNPSARPIYDNWVKFAKEKKLPVEFGMGETHDFVELLSGATALLTTSVAEGFGLAFIEAALMKKSLCGRKLPEITDEFEDKGLYLDEMYTRLSVPLEWVGADTLREKLASALQKSFASYGREVSEEHLDVAFNASAQNGLVDFGRLDEELQMKVIGKVAGGEHCDSLPDLDRLLARSSVSETLEHNFAHAKETYSLSGYGENLLSIYEKVVSSGSEKADDFDCEKLLDCFLAPERFCLLRT